MQRIVRITLVVAVAATLRTTASGQENAGTPTSVASHSEVVSTSITPPSTFNGFDQYRQVPDLGAPGSAGHGFFHFSGPLDRFTTWYRPRAATLTPYQRCAPDSFRPRGYGNLFARPCDGYRMEYSPYKLMNTQSQYGPSYIARMPDPRCEHCDPLVKHQKRACKDCK